MHEASLVSGLIRIINEEAQKNTVSQIVSVKLSLGLLACIEAQTLKACFELFAENTPAHGAVLHVEIEPLKVTCQQCAHVFVLHTRHFVCPNCQGTQIHFTGGHGCTLLAIEAEKANNKE